MMYEFPITERTYKRWERKCETDPELNYPFVFIDTISKKNEYVFILTHGHPDGMLWNGYLGGLQTVKQFIQFMYDRDPRLKECEEIVLLCCHGACMTDVPENVMILNTSHNELHANPPILCRDLDDNFFFGVNFKED